MRTGETYGAGRQELDDNFAATDIGVKMRNGRARMIARDGAESDLADPSTSHYNTA